MGLKHYQATRQRVKSLIPDPSDFPTNCYGLLVELEEQLSARILLFLLQLTFCRQLKLLE